MKKITPKKFYEHDANIVHCAGCDGNDYTLCGFTLDGDQGEITETQGCRISCEQCLSIIQFCQSISSRSLPRGSSLPSTKREGQ